MNTFDLKLFDDEGLLCTFYTVQWEDATESETEKFFNKYHNEPKFVRPVQELAKFLQVIIGDEYGAKESFFRPEDQAHALPPSGIYRIDEISINYAHFPLRLYCLRISESLVVLFNGGEKTSATALGGATSMAFRQANLFAGRILKAIMGKEISIETGSRVFTDTDGRTDDITL